MTETVEAKRTPFIALVSFEIPQGGTTQILATDEAHARALLTEAHKNMRNFQIVDIFTPEEIAQAAEEGEEDAQEEDKSIH